MGFDLWELVFHIVGVHRLDLLSRGSSKHFDNLNQLIDPTLSWEKRLAEHELRHHTTRRPNVCEILDLDNFFFVFVFGTLENQ